MVQVAKVISLDAAAIREGVPLKDGLAQFHAFIANAMTAHVEEHGPGPFDIWLVAHNGHNYDMQVLVLECLRTKHELTVLRRVLFVDTCDIAKRCARLKRPLPLAASPCIDP